MTYCKSTLAALALTALSAGGAITSAAWAQEAAAPEATTAPAAPEAAAPAATAPAAPAGQDAEAAYASARNQLGVLSYCQEQGHIDGKAVEIQTKLLTMIPAGDAAAGDTAETAGKAGTIQAMGIETTVADAATKQSTTEAALCQQMDAMIQQLAAQLPS